MGVSRWSDLANPDYLGVMRINEANYIPKRQNLENKYKQNSVAFIPQANYTDWATATCWRNLVPTFADRVVSRGQRGGSPTVVNLSFLDRSRYFSL
jgi:hypothetical protein